MWPIKLDESTAPISEPGYFSSISFPLCTILDNELLKLILLWRDQDTPAPFYEGFSLSMSFVVHPNCEKLYLLIALFLIQPE